MANFNRVLLIGNLTRDPELRYTPNGTAVADFGLAVNRVRRNRDGEKQEETCFVDITAWARQAEIINEYCVKGRPIFIEGRLQLDQWENREGQKRSKLRVVVENFQLLGGRGPAPNSKRGSSAEGQKATRAPGQSGQEEEPSEDTGFSLGDDDIPF